MRWQQKILAQPKTINSELPLYINQYIRSLSIAEIPTADHLPGFAFPPAARITPTRYRLYCGAGTKAKTHIQALQKHLNVGFGYRLIRQQIGKLEFIEFPAIASQCSHWRGNLLDRSTIPRGWTPENGAKRTAV